MWRKALLCAGGSLHRRLLQPWRTIASQSSSTASYTINSMILRSLEDHYFKVSKMTHPPLPRRLYYMCLASSVPGAVLYLYHSGVRQEISPPSPYSFVTGALYNEGPVLTRMFQYEEINISVMRMVDIVPGGSGDDYSDVSANQLFLHVDISKPVPKESLRFRCVLYPDALRIHSISLRPKPWTSRFLVVPSKYNGPIFEDINEKVRDALHGYIEERGINESLFPFLQRWVYALDYRNRRRWISKVGSFVNKCNHDILFKLNRLHVKDFADQGNIIG